MTGYAVYVGSSAETAGSIRNSEIQRTPSYDYVRTYLDNTV